MIPQPPPVKLTHNELIKQAVPTLAGSIAQTLADPALDRFSDADYGQLIGSLNRPLRRLLEGRNRDTMARAVGSLLTLQPSLLWLTGRRVLWPHRPSAPPEVTLPSPAQVEDD